MPIGSTPSSSTSTRWTPCGRRSRDHLRPACAVSDSGGILGDRTVGHLFRAHLCQVDPSHFGPHGFNCYQALFADLHSTAGVLDVSGRDGTKSGCRLTGAAFVGRRVRVLWRDEKMHNGTICKCVGAPTTGKACSRACLPPSRPDAPTLRHWQSASGRALARSARARGTRCPLG